MTDWSKQIELLELMKDNKEVLVSILCSVDTDNSTHHCGLGFYTALYQFLTKPDEIIRELLESKEIFEEDKKKKSYLLDKQEALLLYKVKGTKDEIQH